MAQSGAQSSYASPMGLLAALLLFVGGMQLVSLRSVSGDSVAEAAYNAIGWMAFGVSALAVAVVIPRESRDHKI